MSFIKRALTERELAVCRRQAEKAFRRLRAPRLPGRRRFLKLSVNEQLLQGPLSPFEYFLSLKVDAKFGTGQVVIPIGRVNLGKAGKASTNLALKLSFLEDNRHPGHIKIWNSAAHYSALEASAAFLRSQGFPVPFHHVIGDLDRDFPTLVTEDLSVRRKVAEAHDFNFSKLRNGEALQKQLAAFVQKLQSLHDEKLLSVNKHVVEGAPQVAFEKCFFVRYHPTARVGSLVLGDLDNLDISYALAPRGKQA
ncbi:MAG: hypothetical protein V1817_03600 [Candidatus Micrarchaeota archaeon]